MTALGKGEQQARAAVRDALIGNGEPPRQADEIVDLAFHAVAQALDAFFAVTGRASTEGVKLNATTVACGVLKDRLECAERTAQAIVKARGGTADYLKVELTGSAHD